MICKKGANKFIHFPDRGINCTRVKLNVRIPYDPQQIRTIDFNIMNNM